MLNELLISNGIKAEVLKLADKAEEYIYPVFKELEKIKMYNQFKVLDAMQKEKLSDAHFTYSTGYGYGDIGRDVMDKIYARIFNCEDALVRPHIVSGTHAISLALQGVLRPDDTLMSITGTPYDTLLKVIGLKGEGYGSLKEFNINYKQIELNDNYKIDIPKVLNELKKDTSIKVISIQRSTGYGWRPSLSVDDIGTAIKSIKEFNPNVICFVDNCYGEFLEEKEPTDVGADLIAGSLIKNIGGGIAPTGGYIAGKQKLIEMVSYRLTAPGLGKDCGSTFGVVRQMLQGLFLAPHVTIEALKGAIFCSKIMELAGYDVSPRFDEKRSDIIQAIKFDDKELLIKFCKGIQKGSPVDSFVECEPWDMPGYSDQVIMAAGAFIQGSSIELSADAPIRPPYIAYVQGGLTYEHSKIGVMKALSQII